MTRLAVFVATVGYSGYFPVAPGTVGSLAGLVFYLLVWWSQSLAVEVGLIVMLFLLGIWAGTTAERYFGGIDPGQIVIDEVVGMLITLAFIPVGLSGALIGFFLFRVFDVIKPFPAAQAGASARRPRRHGRRCDGGGVREHFIAGGALGAAGLGRVTTANEARTAEVIAVGSELLGANRLDTNSLFIAEQLSALGIVLIAKTVVPDDRDAIAMHCAQALSRADVVILTGGLGPTDDDLTRDAVAQVTGRALDEQLAIVQAIEERFARRGMRMPDVNRRQALVLRGATVLANPNGTAPGQWLEHDGKLIVLLPGPPRELRPMLTSSKRVACSASGRALNGFSGLHSS